jgi:hypothetical protein
MSANDRPTAPPPPNWTLDVPSDWTLEVATKAATRAQLASRPVLPPTAWAPAVPSVSVVWR